MPSPTLLSIVESPTHPDFSGAYRRLGFNETRVGSIRKAISQLKSQAPDFVVAEFFYGYGNNYAGVNISNLDVFLYSLQRFAPAARVIVMVDKTERRYVDPLNEILPLHAVLQHPVRGQAMEDLLKASLSPHPGA
ncbi:MAG: hypothetical protein OEN52_04805 [Gammaproteobacteria bacterium]|nr:hypothetical protein [Gammaproteobacteria bacterium]MDH3560256.1 hypothetical protein [Gammaproteobacteria bacterium]